MKQFIQHFVDVNEPALVVLTIILAAILYITIMVFGIEYFYKFFNRDKEK